MANNPVQVQWYPAKGGRLCSGDLSAMADKTPKEEQMFKGVVSRVSILLQKASRASEGYSSATNKFVLDEARTEEVVNDLYDKAFDMLARLSDSDAARVDLDARKGRLVLVVDGASVAEYSTPAARLPMLAFPDHYAFVHPRA